MRKEENRELCEFYLIVDFVTVHIERCNTNRGVLGEKVNENRVWREMNEFAHVDERLKFAIGFRISQRSTSRYNWKRSEKPLHGCRSLHKLYLFRVSNEIDWRDKMRIISHVIVFFCFCARPRHRLFQKSAIKFCVFFFYNKIDWRNRKTQRISMNESWICLQQFVGHHSASVYCAKLHSFSHCCLSKRIRG